MTDAQKRFCEEYVLDFNATRAYKTAYPNCKKKDTARRLGSRLMTKEDITNYIQELLNESRERNKVTQDMIIKELSNIAFFNIKNIYKEDGSLKKVTELDDETARAISSVKTIQRAGAMKLEINPNGKDKEIPIEHIPEQTIEIKANDKKGALELLGKHLGMFKDKVEIEQNKPFEISIKVIKNGS